jgi:transposase
MKEVASGATIVLDNATFHRKRTLRAIAARYDCDVLFLPPYSPDLNPIEKKWAWLKQTLRSTLSIFDSFNHALWAAFQVE